MEAPQDAAARAATIIDVARVAGVSRQTVTRALNGLPDVSEATRQRVVAAARELNYRPNRSAQSLVRGRSVTVGLLVEDLANPYSAELAGALSAAAAARDWAVVLAEVVSPASAARAVSALAERVDGLLVTGCRPSTLAVLSSSADVRRGLPTVILDGSATSPTDVVLWLDHEGAIRNSVDLLVEQRRSHIVYVDSRESSGARREAFLTRAAEQRPSLTTHTVTAAESFRGGFDAVGELLSLEPRPDGVIAYNDVMALGMLRGLAAAGRQVPGDVAVVGFDGLRIGAYVTPPLTSMAIDKQALATAALAGVDALLQGVLPDAVEAPPLGLTLLRRDSA